MVSMEQLDLLLGEALENMMGAVAELRGLNLQESTEHMKHIGRATMELWDIRDALYAVRPDIKRDFVIESKQDPVRFERLSQLHEKAGVAEKAGDRALAQSLYNELRTLSPYGWFRLLAEAGLYRTSGQGSAPHAIATGCGQVSTNQVCGQTHP